MRTPVFYKTTQLGWLALEIDAHKKIITAAFTDQPSNSDTPPPCITQALDAYFANGSTLPASLYHFPTQGTAFQHAVWHAIAAIPIGETITYGTLATRIGRPKAVRAVGAACGTNPLALFIPCHRVVSARGDTTQYHWGNERKQFLLKHESQQP